VPAQDHDDQGVDDLSDTCVVIAAYNEATTIAGVVAGVRKQFGRVVVVDDGSTDETAALAVAAGAEVLRHPVNLGQGAALQTGIHHAVRASDTSYVITFDADGQHDPADAAAMVEVARAGDLQVVLGSRFLGDTDATRGRRLLLAAATRFTRLTSGLAVTDAHNGLRVLRADVARELDLRLHGMSHASEVLHVIGSRGWTWVEHPVTIVYTDYSRAKGQRSYNAFNIVFDLAVDRVRATT
jgi:glycosyltransferase involved in cell wall biosynthesis